MENGGYLFAAFSTVWAVTFGYVLFLFRRQSKLQQELSSLKETLESKDNQRE